MSVVIYQSSQIIFCQCGRALLIQKENVFYLCHVNSLIVFYYHIIRIYTCEFYSYVLHNKSFGEVNKCHTFVIRAQVGFGLHSTALSVACPHISGRNLK